jgi:hypothetical protein
MFDVYNNTMKQIRFITHDEQHVDEETLINGVWAVTRCDVKLTNAALLPDNKEIAMYNGYTESPALTQARRARIDAEIEQCKLRDAIVADCQEDIANLLILLNIIDETSGEVQEPDWLEPVQLVASPYARQSFPEDLGTRFIISGGEVIELDSELPDHWYHDNPNY